STEFSLDLDDIHQLRDFALLIMEHIQEEITFFAENELYLIKNKNKVEARNGESTTTLKIKMEQLFN
ncbi:TPA: hypothetical protein ACVO4Y_003620, partial [Vibrio diabolicus]